VSARKELKTKWKKIKVFLILSVCDCCLPLHPEKTEILAFHSNLDFFTKAGACVRACVRACVYVCAMLTHSQLLEQREEEKKFRSKKIDIPRVSGAMALSFPGRGARGRGVGGGDGGSVSGSTLHGTGYAE